ncbi:MAG: bifunctional 2',3'-cyclic-nucleotide 2'-phosphodiesterase/3'-nucleotidase [Firmicutes bacterium]|nr:bifunctional 2',3'-cyclic-nucleotide 2'-phosphodiesterase/3'-nucleotidase [Bacillota bacterium]
MSRFHRGAVRKRIAAAWSLLAALSLVMALVAPVQAAGQLPHTAPVTGGDAELVIMATSDLHGNIYPWDYYKNQAAPLYGLAKIETLIKQVRADHPNTVLLDDGDVLQGTPLDYYYARVNPIGPDVPHPMYQVMSHMGYLAGSIGNHEFNYGLAFFEEAAKSADFPLLSANIYKPGTKDPYFTPYVIKDVTLKLRDGGTATLKLGIIGFTPPGIVIWDRDNLKGKVETGDIIEAAKRFIPEMKQKGADIIVALAHSGTDGKSSYSESEAALENAALKLADEVPGIDVVVAGHSHLNIPDVGKNAGKDEHGNPISDPIRPSGTVIVQPGYWGNHLAIADLALDKTPSGWKVVDKAGWLIATTTDTPPDPEILDLAKDAHEKTVQYVTSPIGKTLTPLTTMSARLTDTAAIQLINEVQIEKVKEAIKGTQWEGLPVLSAAAPFRAGRGGPSDYTNIPAGDVSIADVASLYIYDNTLKAVEITGKDLKAWLEHSAENFLQVKPGAGDQPILNPTFPGYNFDQIDGEAPGSLQYEIDITKPVGQRVVNLTYNGQPVAEDMKFVLATNNYRAGGGGGFPATGDTAVRVVDTTDESRQLIIDYIRSKGTIAPVADKNWRLAPTYLAHWAAPYAYDLVDREVLRGDPQGRLLLNRPVTRAEFLALLERALGKEPAGAPSAQPAFADVKGHWAEAYVDLGVQLGITKGVSASEFRPDDPITREDAALMVVRAVAGPAGLAGQDLRVLDHYADKAQIDAYAQQAVAFATLHAVLAGYADGTLRPRAAILRGEAAKVIDTSVPEAPAPGVKKLSLVSFNDLHGHIEYSAKRGELGAARLTTAFLGEALRNPEGYLLLDGGDNYQGTVISNLTQGQAVNDWFNQVGLRVSAIGNHEFDWGVPVLLDRMADAKFTYVAANIFDEKTGQRPDWAKPTQMIEVDGLKIGLIGFATPLTKSIVLPQNIEGLEFRDPAPIIDELAPQLRAQGADLVVVVSHLSSDQEGTWTDGDTHEITNEIADVLKRIHAPVDAAITGHTHDDVAGFVQSPFGPVPVVQGSYYGHAYARIDLYYDTNAHRVIRAVPQVVHPSLQLAPNPDVDDLVAKWEAVIGPKKDQVIATLAGDLTRTPSPAGEEVLGDLITDAQLQAVSGAQIALTNGGGIRADLAAGPVKWGDAYSVQPFGNTLVKVQMTGQELIQTLEEGVNNFVLEELNQKGGHGPLQVSGITFTWDWSKPKGQRVSDVKLADGTPVDPNATYTVVVNNFMAAGGDDFNTLKSIPTERKVDTGIIDSDVFIAYLKSLPQPIRYTLQNRITVLGR